MNRSEKLQLLDDKKTAKEMVIITNGQPFIESLQGKIDELKRALGVGIEFTNLDNLIDELRNLQSFSDEIKSLESSLAAIKMPDSVQIAGLDTLVKTVEKLSAKETVVNVEPTDIEPITKALDTLIRRIEKQKVPEQGQQPSDFVPMRRVVKVEGVGLMFDDSFYTGGGGGGGGTVVPTILYQPIAQGGAGTTALVGAVAGKRIKVTNYVVVMGGAGTVKFQSNSSDITGAMSFAANGGVATGGTEFSTVFQTGIGEGLSLVTTGAAGNGHMSYYLE